MVRQFKHLYILIFLLGVLLASTVTRVTYVNAIKENLETFERTTFRSFILIDKIAEFRVFSADNDLSHLSAEEIFNAVDLPSAIEESINAGGRPNVGVTVKITKDGVTRAIYSTKEKGHEQSLYRHEVILNVGNQQFTLQFLPTTAFLHVHQPRYSITLFIAMMMATTFLSFYLREINLHMRFIGDAKRRAEEANLLKSQFLATISHEIRSPMSGVLGMAELLMNSSLTADQRSYTRTILNSGEMLLNIIEDILDLSKIEANKMSLDPVPVNVLELIDDVCALYTPKAREKALELAIRYVPGSEQFVYADPVRLRQILSNLINNAIKFTEKGYVIVTVREDKSKIIDNIARLVFTVEDTGIGIPLQAQEKIFDKFVQADSSTTRDFGGTGLGLSICKNLVGLMDGTMEVKSSPGKGSAFTFAVSFRRNNQETLQQFHPPSLKDVKVLVVDDFPIVCMLVSEQLNIAGMNSSFAHSAEDALEMIRNAANLNDPYKIIIIDYLLPGMNGEVLASVVSKEPAFGKPCLVLLTATDNQTAHIDMMRKGFSAFIAKPVRPRILIETISAVWNKYRDGKVDTLVRLDAPHAHEAEIEHVGLSDIRILMAEDSRINQSFAKDALEPTGCTIDIASNGREALEMIRKHKYDIVLMDCQMPIMDGFEAASIIRDQKAQGLLPRDLPVIALTANAMKGDRQKCLDAGMDDYLSKPVRTRDLKEKIYFWTKRNAPPLPKRTEFPPRIATLPKQGSENEILDINAVRESHQILKDKYPSMLDFYFEDVTNYMDEIKTALETGILNGAVRPAHTIKSTSQRMGAAKLSCIARDIETGVRDGNLNADALQQKYADMAMVFETTRSALMDQNLPDKTG